MFSIFAYYGVSCDGYVLGGGVVCFFNTTLNLESFIKSAGFDLLFILCQNVM